MKKTLLISISAFFVIWVLLGIYWGNALRKNHTLSLGVITSISKVSNKGRKGATFEVEYRRDKKATTAHIRKTQLEYGVEKFIGKSFPVVYRWNGLWYDENILITPEDFSSYGYNFPDSLKWVLEYIDNSKDGSQMIKQ